MIDAQKLFREIRIKLNCPERTDPGSCDSPQPVFRLPLHVRRARAAGIIH